MLVPIRDMSRPSAKALLTEVLLGSTSIAFLAQIAIGLEASVWQAGVIPWEIVHLERVDLPSRIAPALTLVASVFLHGGVLHLTSNMLYLWVFGPSVEHALGRTRYALLYVSAGLIGMAAHALSDPNLVVPAVGASGAVSGILGAHLFLVPRGRIRALLILFIFIPVVELPAVFLIGMWAVMQLGVALLGTNGSVAVYAHLAGFVVGCAVANQHRRHP